MATPSSFPLRLPDDLRARIEQSAQANGRSVNAEIVMLLQQAFSRRDAIGDGVEDLPGGVLLEELMRRYGAAIQVVLCEKPKK